FIARGVKRLLIVEDDATQRESINALIGAGDDVEVTEVSSAEEALELLKSRDFDCMVVDLLLPGVDGGKLIEEVKMDARHRDLPIVVYTGKELSPSEEKRLKRYAESVIVKSGIQSPEKLLEDTVTFLHRVHEKLPAEARSILTERRAHDNALQGRKVLIVDDDVRNI